MSDDYAPFPERELEELAAYHDKTADFYHRKDFQKKHRERAQACRDAIANYKALQERFGLMKLRAETGVTEDAA